MFHVNVDAVNVLNRINNCKWGEKIKKNIRCIAYIRSIRKSCRTCYDIWSFLPPRFYMRRSSKGNLGTRTNRIRCKAYIFPSRGYRNTHPYGIRFLVCASSAVNGITHNIIASAFGKRVAYGLSCIVESQSVVYCDNSPVVGQIVVALIVFLVVIKEDIVCSECNRRIFSYIII